MRVDRTPSVVVLPAPFGPSKPTISPGATSKETSSRTRRPPRSATSRLTEIAGGAVTRRKHSAGAAIRRYPCVTQGGGHDQSKSLCTDRGSRDRGVYGDGGA